MNTIDWIIVALFFCALLGISFFTKRYNRSVADFLAANRSAGRYLLSVANGIAALGAITFIAEFQKFYRAGFGPLWWFEMWAPIQLAIGATGWIVYRYRETRALTMSQFFEMRYSRKFRIFTGILAWVTGSINYGIFPAVTARFFIYFCNFPQYHVNIGPLELNITLGVVMAFMLGIALLFTFWGGQIAVLITDFFQGQVVNIVFLSIVFYLIYKFGWTDIVESLKKAPEGKSMLNPFKQSEIPEFTFSFFAIFIFIRIYSYRAWQGTQGYACSAKSPHEMRMSGIIGHYRIYLTYLTLALIPICIYVFLNTPGNEQIFLNIQGALSGITSEQVQDEVRVPLALIHILPPGMIGLFCSVMIAAAVSTDDTYLHSWGSIFIQDVYLPLRKSKQPMTPEKHMKLLRLSILGIACFAWFFSMLFPLNDYIFMFMTLTGAIYLGGAGAVIIGGLYWKRATAAGAWIAMIAGSILGMIGVLTKNIIWPYLVPWLQKINIDNSFIQNLPKDMPLNGQEMAFCVAVICIILYVVVSLCTKQNPDFDMDRMLHRGKYADEKNKQIKDGIKKGWRSIINISPEFSFWDKVIFYITTGWAFLFFVIFIVGTIYNLFNDVSDDAWAKWWLFYVIFISIAGFVVLILYIVGGIFDLRYMFRVLKSAKRNDTDDGTVVHGHNLSDENKIKVDNKSF